MEGLVLQGIKAGYNSKVIIPHLDLSVEPGQTLVLMGMSGAGKTTLLRTILGIVKPLQGTILLNGRDVTTTPIELRNIGYLAQNYGLFPHLSVKHNIAYGLRVRGIPYEEQMTEVKVLIERMGLHELSDAMPEEISGGQQQRVALARALAIKPALILLDEPLSNIDQVTKFEVAIFLKELFSTLHIPIILVTHQYEDALFFKSSIAILANGIIEQIGMYNDIIAHPKSPLIKRLLTPFSAHD